jgi:hypothetical protein
MRCTNSQMLALFRLYAKCAIPPAYVEILKSTKHCRLLLDWVCKNYTKTQDNTLLPGRQSVIKRMQNRLLVLSKVTSMLCQGMKNDYAQNNVILVCLMMLTLVSLLLVVRGCTGASHKVSLARLVLLHSLSIEVISHNKCSVLTEVFVRYVGLWATWDFLATDGVQAQLCFSFHLVHNA